MPVEREPIGPGVYFGLSEDAYHKDPALGSSDLRQLLVSGPDYWWTSALNPRRAVKEATEAQVFGSALHKLVLEGRQAFEALYVSRPDDLVRLDAKARATLCPNSEIVLKGEDFDRILIAGSLITSNPELATAFEGGMPEVSVFWPGPDGVRLKARFDYLKAPGIGDLKSIRNSRGLPFTEACRRAIADHRYDIQAAHYLDARAALRGLAHDGLTFGDHDAAWLRRVAASAQFGFAWVFFQANEAPVTWATSISSGNPILDVAAGSIRNALETYRTFMAAFGPDEMWVLTDPVNELDIAELPAWWARAA